MRRSFRWLTRLLPPEYVLVVSLLVYLTFEYLAWISAINVNDFLRPVLGSPVREFYKIRDQALLAIALFYGTWRVSAFHPLYRPGYAEWLKQTPWTSRHPLPVGPIHLVVQDAIVAILIIAAMHSSEMPWQRIPIMLLVGHGVAIGLALFWTRPRVVSYLAGFFLGALILVSRDPNHALIVAVGVSIVAHGGIRSQLTRFPWELTDSFSYAKLGFAARPSEVTNTALGFPFDGLSPKHPPPPLITWADGLALSFLPAWWAFAVMTVEPGAVDVIGMLLVYATVGLTIRRLVVYFAVYWPPISLWGRFMTGRWIVPGYDRALAAPFLAPFLAITLMVAGLRYNIPLTRVYPACIAAVLLVNFNMGPSLRTWRLTGAYRLVPSKDRKNLIEL